MFTRRTEAVVAGLATVGGVLVTLAAVAGPGALLPDGHREDQPHPTAPSRLGHALVHVAPPTAARRPPDPLPQQHSTALLLWLLLALGALLLVIAALVLLRRRRRRAPPPASPGQRVPVGGDGDVEMTARRGLARTVVEQREAIAVGEPRNAIVACWLAFEEYAERVGVPHAPWETSSEFVVRFLGLVSADPGAVARLAALFREARFSTHELGEAERADALAALDAIRAALPTITEEPVP